MRIPGNNKKNLILGVSLVLFITVAIIGIGGVNSLGSEGYPCIIGGSYVEKDLNVTNQEFRLKVGGVNEYLNYFNISISDDRSGDELVKFRLNKLNSSATVSPRGVTVDDGIVYKNSGSPNGTDVRVLIRFNGCDDYHLVTHDTRYRLYTKELEPRLDD